MLIYFWRFCHQNFYNCCPSPPLQWRMSKVQALKGNNDKIYYLAQLYGILNPDRFSNHTIIGASIPSGLDDLFYIWKYPEMNKLGN